MEFSLKREINKERERDSIHLNVTIDQIYMLETFKRLKATMFELKGTKFRVG